MSIDQKDIELIEKYLNGNMNEAERFAFEARLYEDREFARKCRLMKTFPTLMGENASEEKEKQEPEEYRWEFNTKPASRISARLFFLLFLFVMAAAAVLFYYSFRPGHTSEKVVTVSQVPAKSTETPEKGSVASPEMKPALSPEKGPAPSAVQEKTTPVEEVAEAPYTLLSPADREVVNRQGEILFRWKQQPDSITHIYISAESIGKVVWWRAVKPGIREFRIPAISFRPGRYYWYVGVKESERSFIVSE
jgi:hypothetical protein